MYFLVDSSHMNEEIPEKVSEYLQGGQAKMSKFYHLLKTHKIPIEQQNPKDWLEKEGYPIRGIISGRGSPTERLGGLVEHFLQPGMSSLPSFLKDTKHVLQIIEDINEKIDRGEFTLEGVGLITLDVEKMYNTMTEELALAGTKSYLERVSQEIDVHPDSILKGLDICLKNNFFQFKDKIFQQISGVGTGLKLAPPYACLGMGEYETQAFNSHQPLLEQVLLWKRYIDDVFGLFKGPKEEFESLVTWLNTLKPGVVKFTANISYNQVEFLDLLIKIENGKLKTDSYIKPSNLQMYLQFIQTTLNPAKQD